MPGTTAPPTILTDAGYLFWAPIGTTIPGSGTGGVVSGSVFTDSWAAPWVSLGGTEDGSQFTYSLTVEAVNVAEFYDPVVWRTTGRTGMFAFNLASYTMSNLAKALNGSAPTIVSGSGATLLSRVRPPVVGTEVRSMIGWESLDNTVRMIAYQTLQSGQIQTAYRKAPNLAVIPTQWNFELPSSGVPFEFYSAGAARG